MSRRRDDPTYDLTREQVHDEWSHPCQVRMQVMPVTHASLGLDTVN